MKQCLSHLLIDFASISLGARSRLHRIKTGMNKFVPPLNLCQDSIHIGRLFVKWGDLQAIPVIDSAYHRVHVRCDFIEFADEKSLRIGNELSVVGAVFANHRRFGKPRVIDEVRGESRNRISYHQHRRHTTSKRELDLRRLMDVARNGELVAGGVIYCKCGERVTRSRESLYDEVSGSRYLPTGPQRRQAEAERARRSAQAREAFLTRRRKWRQRCRTSSGSFGEATSSTRMRRLHHVPSSPRRSMLLPL